jgi:predicted RNA-binding Zn ribbon-like protein
MSGMASIARVGGHPALDFANTAGWHAGEERLEHLTSYGEWVAWLRQGDSQVSALAAALRAEAARNPVRATRALAEVIARRELVYRVFTAIARKQSPQASDLNDLHQARVEALEASEPAWERGHLVHRWKPGTDLLTPLHPIMLAACELLESSQVERLRQCANHPCGWLFLDQSKNGSRRWCSSAECGNATRVRRFRSRQRRGE